MFSRLSSGIRAARVGRALPGPPPNAWCACIRSAAKKRFDSTVVTTRRAAEQTWAPPVTCSTKSWKPERIGGRSVGERGVRSEGRISDSSRAHETDFVVQFGGLLGQGRGVGGVTDPGQEIGA